MMDEWKLVPVELQPEQIRKLQTSSELGAYAAANLSGAYLMFSEFWGIALDAAPVPPAGSSLSQQYVLRAMAHNYRNGHSWDHLDGEAVAKAADEITRMQAENAALQQRLNVADQRVADLETDNAKARELIEQEASSYQVHADDLGIAKHNREWYQAQADRLRAQLSAPAAKREHILYRDGDSIGCIPESILDRNGQVALDMCTVCGKAEAELNGPCEGAPAAKGGSDVQ